MRACRCASITLVALAAAGCARFGFVAGHSPRIIIGDENEVTIETEGLGRPDKRARSHCALHGKSAAFEGMLRPDQYDDLRLVYYRCR